MDPNELLRLLRLTIKQRAWDTDPAIRKAHDDEIAEYFQALDEWIVNGGFLPADWTNDVTKGLLRDLVGDHCESHAEHEPSCSTCIAVLVSA